MKKIIFFISLIAALGGTLIFLASGIDDVKLESFIITSIESIDEESFNVNGIYTINNPSRLSVPVKSITYEVILEETGEVIGKGTIFPFILSKGESEVDFNQEINWKPSVILLANLATSSQTNILIKGNVSIKIPFVADQSIPFEQTKDILEHIISLEEQENEIGIVDEGIINDITNEEENDSNIVTDTINSII